MNLIVTEVLSKVQQYNPQYELSLKFPFLGNFRRNDPGNKKALGAYLHNKMQICFPTAEID